MIFSFAVHHWIKMSPQDYSARISSLINSGGYLLFETHNLKAEDNQQEYHYTLFCSEFEKAGFVKLKEASFEDVDSISSELILYRKWFLYKKN